MKIEDLRVLLVEPSHVQRHIVVDQLRGLGVWQVREVESGSAIESFEGVDVVLSALHMEGESGVELVTRMRSDERLAALPFVLLSSERDARELEPIRQSGVAAILEKPCRPEELRAALEPATHLLDPASLHGQLDLEGLHALVVDDSRVTRRYMSSVLNGLGICRVTEAGDGGEAIDALRETFFDVVISDYNMPNVNGYELLKHIRNESRQPSVPVMMVTSEADDARLDALRAAGVSGLCGKPFEPAYVRGLLLDLLR